MLKNLTEPTDDGPIEGPTEFWIPHQQAADDAAGLAISENLKI